MIGIGEVDHIGEHHLASEIAAFEQQPRGDPGATLAPAGDRRGIEQHLAERLADHVRIGDAGKLGEAELAIGRDDQFGRRFDVGRDRRAGEEHHRP